MLQSIMKAGFFVFVVCLWSGFASAGAITCEPDDQRVATLSDAISCETANSINLNDGDDIKALFGTSYDWYKEGELTGVGSNDLFEVDADSWGVDVTGTWYIDASFWTMYSNAVITMHVGQGGGNPDAFAWLITPGETSGSFSYERVSGTGGGLSNMFLFGSGTPREVPEPQLAFLLLMGLASMFAARRRI